MVDMTQEAAGGAEVAAVRKLVGRITDRTEQNDETDQWERDAYALLDHLAARIDAVEAEAARLHQLLVEHHAAGALDGVLPGDLCPICRRRGAVDA
jgi:hypothetical protein